MISNPVLCVVCWSATSDVVSSNNAARDATPTRPDCLCSHTAPGHLRLQSVYKQKRRNAKEIRIEKVVAKSTLTSRKRNEEFSSWLPRLPSLSTDI